MASYQDLVHEVLDAGDGVLEDIAVRQLKRSFIDLCERAEIWQETLTGTIPATPSGTGPYDFRTVGIDFEQHDPVVQDAGKLQFGYSTPPSYLLRTEVRSVVWLRVENDVLEPSSYYDVTRRFRNRRELLLGGIPRFFCFEPADHEQSRSRLLLYPNDTDNSAFEMRAVLCPKWDQGTTDDTRSLQIPDPLLDQYRETLVEGAIYRLLRMPNQKWSNFRSSEVYRGHFEQAVAQFQTRADGRSKGAPVVRYNGFPSERGVTVHVYGEHGEDY